jgi:hypothetical protein
LLLPGCRQINHSQSANMTIALETNMKNELGFTNAEGTMLRRHRRNSREPTPN